MSLIRNVASILAVLAPACIDAPELGSESSDVIIGANHLQDVEAYTNPNASPFGVSFVNYYKSPVGEQIGPNGSGGYEACTGTMIGRDLYLTAAHCSHAGTVTFREEYVYQNGVNTGVTANQATDAYDVVGVAECGYQTLCGSYYNLHSTAIANQRDYQVLRLAPNSLGQYPGDVYGWRRWDTTSGATLAASLTPLAQIQHPGAVPTVVDTGAATAWDGLNLSNNVDSNPGSSGSGMLDRFGRIIGLDDQQGNANNYGPVMADIVHASTVLKGPLFGNTYQLVYQVQGSCLDVPGYSQASGQPVAVNACKSSGNLANQEVDFIPIASGGYTARAHHSQLCLGVSGAAVVQSTCTGSTTQIWDLVQSGSDGTATGFQIRTRLGVECVAPTASNWLQIGTCTSTTLWRFTPTSQFYKVQLAATAQCLDMIAYSTTEYTRAQIQVCKSDPTDIMNQEWRLRPEAGGRVTIENAYSGMCLSPVGSGDAALIEQTSCSSSLAQRWTVNALAGNAYALQNAFTGSCIDNSSGSLHQHACGTSPTTQNLSLTKAAN